MISLAPGHARLWIDANEPFDQVSESIRTLLQLCRLNKLDGLVVSAQAELDWRSSMRVALRFAAIRGGNTNFKLAFVAKARADVRDAVLEVARTIGAECAVFGREESAVGWLARA